VDWGLGEEGARSGEVGGGPTGRDEALSGAEEEEEEDGREGASADCRCWRGGPAPLKVAAEGAVGDMGKTLGVSVFLVVPASSAAKAERLDPGRVEIGPQPYPRRQQNQRRGCGRGGKERLAGHGRRRKQRRKRRRRKQRGRPPS
jgi:hypothetical protein